jgi:hypothetical protein
MIVLFNLNKYVGGGEILTIRFAQYLHDHNIAYTMLAFGENCYIADQAKARGLNITPWPIEEDSVAYMNDADRKDLLQKMTKIFEKEKLIYPFSFCFRDLYNSLFLFTRFTKTEVRLSTGIYHPEDVLYLSSLSLNKSKIINFNKKIIHSLAQKNAVLFPNETALYSSLGKDVNFKPANIALPIPMPERIPEKQLHPSAEKINIICISRFVSFKIAAILAIVRFVRHHQKFELSIVGYGLYRFVLATYIRFHGIKNVKIYSGIGPEQLDTLVDKATIGYAQGTSILEIAKRGLPVVIAPYSTLLDVFNKYFLCMGVFGEQNNYNFGDYISNGGKESVPIAETILKVVADYPTYRDITIEHAKRFSADIICKQMYEYVLTSEYTNKEEPFNLPQGPFIKKVLRKILTNH